MRMTLWRVIFVKRLIVIEKFDSVVVDVQIGPIRNVAGKTLPKISYVILALINPTLIDDLLCLFSGLTIINI